jgi:glycosyltransferase involved in cell wall biosynthesis
MKICLVSQEYPPETAWGGIGTQTLGKAQCLARLGHEVHVLSRSADAAAPDLRTDTEGGIVVHRMQPPGHEFPIYCRGTYLLGYTWFILRQLNRLMEQTAFDVIDFPEFGGEGFAYQLDRTVWNWLPVVVNIHGPLAMFVEHFGWPEKGNRFHRFATFTEEFTIHRADAVMAVSSTIADLASEAYHYPREKIDIVHCGVHADLFTPAPGGNPVADRPTVLFVGNIIENKGIDTLFDAVMQLRRKYPDILLQIVGKEDMELAPRFRAQMQSDGAQDNVRFLGFVDMEKLPEFYRAAHVFCAPAEFEGLGTVYLEAMASGCPVVASTAGGTHESVLDGQTGLLVPPRNVSATADALDRLLTDGALRGRMGEAGRRRVEEYFTMERFTERVLAVYEKAIARSERSPDRWKDERE